MMLDSKLKTPKFASDNPFFPKIHKELKAKNLKEKKLNLKIKELEQEMTKINIELKESAKASFKSHKLNQKEYSSAETNKSENLIFMTSPSVISQETLKNG